jgi:polysaccharide pyruvyl transferase WcaK-like protein
MKSVLFSGYYGQRNTGDDAFCVVAAWGAKKYWRVNNIAFLSSVIPMMSTPARTVLPKRQFMKGQAALFGLIPSMVADEIVYFGGSIFHARSQAEGVMRWFHERLSKSFVKKKISAVGVSLGPFPTRKDFEKEREFLKGMSFLSVRDLKSYEIAFDMKLDLPVVRAFDPALLLPLANEGGIENDKSGARGRRILGISLCRYESFVDLDASVERARERAIIEGLKKFLEQHDDVILRFFILNDHPVYSDMRVTQGVVDALPKVTVEIEPYSNDPGKALSRIAQCHAFFSIRLHAAIFSFASMIPFALVEYHRKCTDFLDEIGCEDALRLERDVRDPDKVDAVLSRLMASSENTGAASCRDKLRECHSLALENFLKAPFCRGRGEDF